MRKLMDLEGNVVSTSRMYRKAAVHTVVISAGAWLAIGFLRVWIPTFVKSYQEETARLQEMKK
jgi:hypothetical protein